MATLSFFDKISILFEVSKSSKLFIIALFIILFLGIVLVTTNKKNAKTSRKLFVSLYVFITLAIFVLYRENLSNMFQYMMENLFVAIYFPNLAIYFGAILISGIILWVSVFNFQTPKIIKNINIVFYSIINYLLIVLITIINEQKLDVFNKASIYTNRSAQAIIELSSTIFIIWVIYLFIYKAIMIYQTRNNKVTVRKVVRVQKITKKPLVKEIAETKEKVTPKFIKEKPTFIPKIQVNEQLQKYENLFTLEDYKVLLTILKEQRQKEKEELARKQREEKNNARFRELKELYGIQ